MSFRKLFRSEIAEEDSIFARVYNTVVRQIGIPYAIKFRVAETGRADIRTVEDAGPYNKPISCYQLLRRHQGTALRIPIPFRFACKCIDPSVIGAEDKIYLNYLCTDATSPKTAVGGVRGGFRLVQCTPLLHCFS